MNFKIGEINVLPWLTEYNLQLVPQYGSEGFTCVNGYTVGDYKGDKVSVSFSLRRVPGETAAQISQVLSGKSFSCAVSAPCEISVMFSKTTYRAEPYNKGQSWNFDVTIESVSLINSGDRL